MAKRDLIEQLDQAVERMIANPGAPLPRLDAAIAPLVRLAADLHDLPRESFKTRLKSELERKSSMATLAEPTFGEPSPTKPATAMRTVASPRLTFKDAAKAIEFYKEAFGAKETFRFSDGQKIPHAEIMIGGSLIMLADEWPEGGRLSAETLAQSPVELSLQVDDVDSFAARAVAAGLKTTMPIADQFYGRRQGRFVDPFGYGWNIFTVKEEMPLEEMYRRFNNWKREESKKTAGVSPVPAGYRTVTPYLIAADGPALLEFTKQAFGAEEKFRAVGSAGGLHAEARIGDSTLMVGGGIPGREFRATPNTTALHVYVEDVDAVYRRALDAGATSMGAPVDQEYGERSASVKDAAGNWWYIATHKGPRYVPEGLNDVNVYMHPLRGEPVISFLKRAFGAQEIAKYASPDGVIHHAEIRVGSSVVELGEAHGPYQPMKSTFYMYVPDVDAIYHRALQAGATSISAPADQPYGDRNAGVTDPFGNQWYISMHIKDVEV